MSDDVLLQFLSNGLIDVGGDDTKLEKLRTTADDLASSLTDRPALAASYALIAFDPNAPSTDPVVTEALEALKRRWATYVNTFSRTPVAVVRAMLLDALAKASVADDRIGVGFVASARNALPFMEVGNEKTIWAAVITTIENRVDAKAESEWATPASIIAPPMTFAPPDPAAPQLFPGKIKRDALKAKIHAAAGPQAASGATSGNPHWPQQQVHWVTEFGNRMAEVVADAIEGELAQTKIGQVDLSEPLQRLASTVSTHVEGTLLSVSSATSGLQRRTNLLWWRQALYSPSAHRSYRSLPAESAAALMALDLHQQVPTFSPASVTAFLHEAVCDLPSVDPATTYAIRDLTIQAREAAELVPLRSAAASLVPPAQGRGPLLALIGNPHAPVVISDIDFRRLSGVSPDASLSLPTWATWLFREFQAARAAAEGKQGKRQSRKGQSR